MISCFDATSTQQPWQRRLQLLMIETYRNGGKNSPRRIRRLCFCTDRTPRQPIFTSSFHTSRLSVSSSMRLARRKYIGSESFQKEASAGSAWPIGAEAARQGCGFATSCDYSLIV